MFNHLNNSDDISCMFWFPDETMIINVFCGVVSGVMSSMMANPTDVLKVIVNANISLRCLFADA